MAVKYWTWTRGIIIKVQKRQNLDPAKSRTPQKSLSGGDRKRKEKKCLHRNYKKHDQDKESQEKK